MKLSKVTIEKYKSIETPQEFSVEDTITVLVGMNESGKTSVLEAIAKTNYFRNDAKFKFDTTHDYPRREKKALDKSGDNPVAIRCDYTLPDDLIAAIEADLCVGVLTETSVSISTRYDNTPTWAGIRVNSSLFIDAKLKELGIHSQSLIEKLKEVKTKVDFEAVLSTFKEEKKIAGLQQMSKFFDNSWNWANDPIREYVVRTHIKPKLPKFLYYDEYYALPSRISIEELQGNNLDEDEMKTAQALFELADIDLDQLLASDEYEDFKAELEATQASISDVLFKYWTTNTNLEIEFNIDKRESKGQRTVNDASGNPVVVDHVEIVEHILDIRVRNTRSRVSLPLKNRSKGFNWFFSFLVWFKKIQEDKGSNYVILLDEPGLNLHASAQADLLRFFNDLSGGYQIIYTTHSPFMIDSNSLQAVRTVLETDKGTKISDSLQEKDPKTLFPLQAALGYDIAQNLFISNNNLLVEGPADLLILTAVSSILQKQGREGLEDKITVVPVGGLDKVPSFISLLRGSNLNLVCVLDTFIDQGGKQRVENLIRDKIIKDRNIRFFDEFANENKTSAEIEDLFEVSEYLELFNRAFDGEYRTVTESDVSSYDDTMIKKINSALGIKRFNHYRPAMELMRLMAGDFKLSDETLSRFENLFRVVNKLFSSNQ